MIDHPEITERLIAKLNDVLPIPARLTPELQVSLRGQDADTTIPAEAAAFQTISTAQVSKSAAQARDLMYLRESDGITMNRDRVVTDAKERALELLRSGYEPPQPRTDIPAPGENILAALKMGVHLMRQGEYITEYEVKIGTKVAEILCGGNVTLARAWCPT